MRVERADINSNAYRQTQFHVGEHLAYYHNPVDHSSRTPIHTEEENSLFTSYLEEHGNQRGFLTNSSTKERGQEHADREELMKRLNYTNGMHYSAAQNISI